MAVRGAEAAVAVEVSLDIVCSAYPRTVEFADIEDLPLLGAPVEEMLAGGRCTSTMRGAREVIVLDLRGVAHSARPNKRCQSQLRPAGLHCDLPAYHRVDEQV